MTGIDVFLWIVVPYLCIATFALGHLWRYRYDKFGWTTRSSQLHENRLLRWGSPLFHFGILAVIGGHVLGLLVPKSWTRAAGVGDHAYPVMAAVLGTTAGVCTVAGLGILLYRRVTVGPVRSATTRTDKGMYVLLAATLLAGLTVTVMGDLTSEPHDYRLTVAPYFRSVLYAAPDIAGITAAPLAFQLHTMLAWLLIAVWPFTRLVHVFSAPVGYLTRPYVVYRSREATAHGMRPAPRGWESTGPARGR